MGDGIRIAIVGPGEAGEIFSEHLREKIHPEKTTVRFVALADPDLDGPVAMGFLRGRVPVCADSLDLIKHCDEIDTIFNLRGDVLVSRQLGIELLAGMNAARLHNT